MGETKRTSGNVNYKANYTSNHTTNYKTNYKPNSKTNYKTSYGSGNNKPLRFIISAALSFLLCLLLAASALVFSVFGGFMTESGILSALDYDDYYAGAEAAFYQNAADINMPIGLPEDVLDGIVSYDKIKADIRGYVSAGLKKEKYVFDTSDLQAKLAANVYALFQSEGEVMDEVQQATLPEYTQMIADEYVSLMKVPLMTQYGSIRAVFEKALIFTAVACVTFSAIIIIIIFRMYTYKHRAVRFAVYGVLGAGVMTAIPSAAALISGFYRRLNISPEYLYNALTRYINTGLRVPLYAACLLFLLAAALLLVIYFMKRRVIEQARRSYLRNHKRRSHDGSDDGSADGSVDGSVDGSAEGSADGVDSEAVAEAETADIDAETADAETSAESTLDEILRNLPD